MLRRTVEFYGHGHGATTTVAAFRQDTGPSVRANEDNHMPEIAVYQEILDWSANRPPWQQDALRRLVTQGQLDESDIIELASLCKAKEGLEDPQEHKPLKEGHLPIVDAAGDAVRLTQLTHQRGVNALAPNQTIEFGPNLTIVYGDNGAGKSGYARILKRACRARGSDPILGNVISGAQPPVPSALIRYSVGGKSTDFSWDDQAASDQQLSRVSVFDRQCASVYISKATDVAFRPMGLDLFNRLVDVCEDVKKVLKREQKILEDQKPNLPTAPPNTSVAFLLENITALTSTNQIHALSRLSDGEIGRMNEIRARKRDIANNNPQAVVKTLLLRADRLSTFLDKLSDMISKLSDSSVRDLFQARSAFRESERALEKHKSTFNSMPVAGIGSASWRRLWDAARYFFTSEAYPHKSHPSRDAHCVLCQQPHSDESFTRMQELERHVSSIVQLDHEKAEEEYRSLHDGVKGAFVNVDEAIQEVSIDDLELSRDIASLVKMLEGRRESVLAAIGGERRVESVATLVNPPELSSLAKYISTLHERAKKMTESNAETDVLALEHELAELESRYELRANIDLVLAEVRRKAKIGAYQRCIKETHTSAITLKSKELTRKVVTDRLVQAFADERSNLKFDHVEVDLAPAGGSKGALYHKLILRRAPKSDVAEVVSEGEARCLSIASFFAELSTADDRSAILFDDPVSSLDHTWRDSVAERLVAEAENRQVVVFTHDLSFQHVLLAGADRRKVDVTICCLRRTDFEAGFVTTPLPMRNLNVSRRIGHLRNLWQDAQSLFAKREQEEYERKGGEIYGLLREAWERGVEEVLLSGVVERFRPSIQTQNRVMVLHDITEEDCVAVQAGMTKCSTFLHGHDQASAYRLLFPKPDEVKDDIDALDSWRRTIVKRREATRS